VSTAYARQSLGEQAIAALISAHEKITAALHGHEVKK
jgi:hypothetical protein